MFKRAQDARLVSAIGAMVGQAQGRRKPAAVFLHQGGRAMVGMGQGLDVIARVELSMF